MIDIVLNRIESLITYNLKSTIEPLINEIIALIPDTFLMKNLGETGDVYLSFFLNSNMVIM